MSDFNGAGGVHRDTSVTDSFGPTSIAMDTYKQRLPRRRKKASDGCWGLTCYSWLFLLLALLQAALVTGIQIAIAVLGRFVIGEGRLSKYEQCFELSLNASLDTSKGSPNTNVSIDQLLDNFDYPSFGRDKGIYIYFFIAVVLYNFFLCLYALKRQNIVEVYMFMVINILAMCYAGLQVYQFRGFGFLCPPVTDEGYLALANVLVLLIFTFIFAFLSLFIYVEFGWKTYLLVDCNPGMRYYYRVYQVFMSIVKLFLLFLVIFSVIQVVLLLKTDDFEFYLTIILSLAAIAAFPFIYLIATFEFLPGAILLLILGVALMAYDIFKIFRYVTQNCPVCQDRTEEVQAELDRIRNAIFGENSTNVENTAEVTRLFDRAQDFQNLTLFAVANLIVAIVTIVIFIHYWRQWNNGLKDYFVGKYRLHQWIDEHCCGVFKRCTGGSFKSFSPNDNKVEEGDGIGVKSLDLHNNKTAKKTRKRNNNNKTSDSVLSKSRDSSNLEQSSYSPVRPNFNPADVTNSQRTTIN